MEESSRSTLLQQLRNRSSSRNAKLLIAGLSIALPALVNYHLAVAVSCSSYNDCFKEDNFDKTICVQPIGDNCSNISLNYDFQQTISVVNYVCNESMNTCYTCGVQSAGCCSSVIGTKDCNP